MPNSVLILVVNRSIYGLRHKCSNPRFKKINWSIHSVSARFDRDSLSATVFSFAGMWHCVKSVQIRTRNNSLFGHFSRSVSCWKMVSWLITHYQIFRTWWWHSIECDVPNLLMQWIAVVMSDMTLMCLWLVFTNDVKATKIAFSSRILMCIGFSFGNHALPLDTSPMEALQLSIEVYVLILMLNLGYLIGLKTLNMFFFYHDISWKVSSDSFIIALESPLL